MGIVLPVCRGMSVLTLCLMLAFPASVEARPAPDSFADTVDHLMPAVVNISTTQHIKGRAGMVPEFDFPDIPGSPFEQFREFFEQLQPQGDEYVERKAFSLGSGFVVDPDGYIVTNAHVIADAEEVSVKFSDNKELPAEIIGRDPKTDLALLKVKSNKSLPYVSFGDSDKARVGDWVIAIGNPFGLGGSVTAGIISARARDINAGPFDDFLQTDAAINRGNSGGPMFNLKGEVIGINTAIFSPTGGNIGIGFATPASLARPVIEQLKENGKVRRGWLGVKIQTVTDEIADSIGLDDPSGALVVDVTPGSPAAEAGLTAGDVILEYNDEALPEMRKLPRMVADTRIGSKVSLDIWRKGEKEKVRVVIGESPENPEQLADAGDDDDSGQEPGDDAAASSQVMGMTLIPLSDEVRAKLRIDRKAEGLVVARIQRGSVAWQQGIRRYDLIMRVNEESIKTVADFKQEIEKASKKGRKFVLLRLRRENVAHFLTLPIGETTR